MTAGESPVAFLSYTRADDEHEGGLISAFRERLQGEVQFLSGDNTFSIFQDRINIKWGQDWRTRIAESLDNAVFLIPVITSRFFKSEACCEELDCFLHRERSLGRRDLVLPLYYGTCPTLDNPAKRGQNSHAQAIADHQYRDWRDLRFASLSSQKVRRRIGELATEITAALACTSSLPPEPERLISAPILRTPTPIDKGIESNQPLNRTTEQGPPTEADLPAKTSEADTFNEMRTRASEDGRVSGAGRSTGDKVTVQANRTAADGDFNSEENPGKDDTKPRRTQESRASKTGQPAAREHTCSACGGRGYIHYSVGGYGFGRSFQGLPHDERCSSCGGTGKRTF